MRKRKRRGTGRETERGRGNKEERDIVRNWSGRLLGMLGLRNRNVAQAEKVDCKSPLGENQEKNATAKSRNH